MIKASFILCLLLCIIEYIKSEFIQCTCQQVFTKDECLVAKCHWIGEICVYLNCIDRGNQEECETKTLTSDNYLNCHWDQINSKCLDVSKISCPDFETDQCPVYCSSDDAGCDDEIAFKCSSFSISEDCDGKEDTTQFCYWNETTSKCGSLTMNSKCAQAPNQQLCDKILCKWNESCVASECSDFQQPDCKFILNENRSSFLCNWDSNGTCIMIDEENFNTSIDCGMETNFTWFNNGIACQQCNKTLSIFGLLLVIELMIILFE